MTSPYEKLNPEIKTAWVAALRSDEYTQGKGMLRSRSNRYCGMGVLCDVLTHFGFVTWTLPYDADSWVASAEHFGHVEHRSGSIPYGEQIGLDLQAEQELIGLNDRAHSTFNQIADWIEEWL